MLTGLAGGSRRTAGSSISRTTATGDCAHLERKGRPAGQAWFGALVSKRALRCEAGAAGRAQQQAAWRQGGKCTGAHLGELALDPGRASCAMLPSSAMLAAAPPPAPPAAPCSASSASGAVAQLQGGALVQLAALRASRPLRRRRCASSAPSWPAAWQGLVSEVAPCPPSPLAEMLSAGRQAAQHVPADQERPAARQQMA